ncbi:hypothetical protein L9F63_000489, partial [Diploptera punctata]
ITPTELWLTMNMIMFEIAISWKHESYEQILKELKLIHEKKNVIMFSNPHQSYLKIVRNFL